MKTTILMTKLCCCFLIASPLACMTRKDLILSIPVMSMTKLSYPNGTKLKELGTVKAKFCTTDTPTSTKSINVGIIDELVFRAQTAKKCDFIKNAQIFVESNNCFSLEGIAAK